MNPEFESNLPKTSRHGGAAPVRDSIYSEEDLLRINREFDRKNGWSHEFGAVLTNRHRLPETVFGPPETAWQNRT